MIRSLLDPRETGKLLKSKVKRTRKKTKGKTKRKATVKRKRKATTKRKRKITKKKSNSQSGDGWILDRADRLRRMNPSMSTTEALSRARWDAFYRGR